MKKEIKMEASNMKEQLNKKVMYKVSEEEQMVNEIKDRYQMIITKSTNPEYRSKLVMELLKMQKKDGSWSVIDDYNCDGDTRVEYVYKPTYYATAALIYADFINNYTETSIEKEALLKGLDFVHNRGLSGHGFRATEGLIETLNVYKKACLYKWMKCNEGVAVEFCNMITRIIEGFRKGLITGNTYSDWDRDFTKEFENEVKDYEDEMLTYVWYASYGSNISKARFMKYINRCSDKTAPLEDRPIIIPYEMYFASRSTIWDNKGVAFLDDSKEGTTWGRIYKITLEQFREVQKNEGSKYTKRVSLGRIDGIPVYTFTSPSVRSDRREPSLEYLNVIKEGLKEIYSDKTELTLDMYLYQKGILGQDDYKVLKMLRESAHGVKLQTLVDAGIPKTRLMKVVEKLYDLELIKQDGRSIRAGYAKKDLEAVVYTRKEKREMVDIMLLCRER